MENRSCNLVRHDDGTSQRARPPWTRARKLEVCSEMLSSGR